MERTNVVFGKGPEGASLMLVGEGPGEQEDLKGVPFAGRAGKNLDRMLEENGIERKRIYITNAVKCRPPSNRKPRKKELRTCFTYLEGQIACIKPDIVATMGNTPTEIFLEKLGLVQTVKELRGKGTDVTLDGHAFVLFPIYHPAASLHNPLIKEKVDRSFKELGKCLERIETIQRNP